MINLNTILPEARETVKTMQTITIPSLERRLRINYHEASKVLAQLMAEGTIVYSTMPPYQINTPFNDPT